MAKDAYTKQEFLRRCNGKCLLLKGFQHSERLDGRRIGYIEDQPSLIMFQAGENEGKFTQAVADCLGGAVKPLQIAAENFYLIEIPPRDEAVFGAEHLVRKANGRVVEEYLSEEEAQKTLTADDEHMAMQDDFGLDIGGMLIEEPNPDKHVPQLRVRDITGESTIEITVDDFTQPFMAGLLREHIAARGNQREGPQ